MKKNKQLRMSFKEKLPTKIKISVSGISINYRKVDLQSGTQ
jgi:hypothetical protein